MLGRHLSVWLLLSPAWVWPCYVLQVQVVFLGAKSKTNSTVEPVIRVQLKHSGVQYLFDGAMNK